MIRGATTWAKFLLKVSDAEFLHVFHDLSLSSMQNNIFGVGRQAPGSGVSKPAVEMLGVGTRWGSQQSPSRLGEERG